MMALLRQTLTVAAQQNPAAVAFWAMVIVALSLVLTYLLLRDAMRSLAPVLHTYAETRRPPRRRATKTAGAQPAAHRAAPTGSNGVAPAAALQQLRR